MRLGRELSAVFLPGDPPRAGGFAVWGDRQGSDQIELVLPAGRGVRRRRVRGRVLPLATALPTLLTASTHEVSSVLAAWSAAAAAGVGLVARGRLLPAASPGGYDAWRVGPLDAPDLELLRRIAAAMPLHPGHVLVVTFTDSSCCGGSPPRCRPRRTPCPSTGVAPSGYGHPRR